MRAPCSTPILVVLAMAASGCASSTAENYPSLAVRPAERMEGSFTPVPQAPAPTPMPEGTLGRLGELEASARAAHARFREQAATARGIVLAGRGTAVGDNRWGAAQIALADLDSLRSQTAVALGDLDQMYVDATVADSDRQAIDASRRAVVAIVAEQDRVLADLRGVAGQ